MKKTGQSHGVQICTWVWWFRSPQQVLLRPWWKTEEVDSPLCGNISRETVSGSEISNRGPEAAFRCQVASWMDRRGYGRDCTCTQRGTLGTFTWSPSKYSSQPVSKTEPHTQISVIAGFSFKKFLGIDDESPLWQRCLLAQ